jgi:hypothetical protein
LSYSPLTLTSTVAGKYCPHQPRLDILYSLLNKLRFAAGGIDIARIFLTFQDKSRFSGSGIRLKLQVPHHPKKLVAMPGY